MAGVIRKKKIHDADQFWIVDNTKLQASLILMADRYSDKVRALIYATYNDDEINSIYRAIRRAQQFEKGNWNRAKGGKTAYYRKLFEFPNGYVADFCNTVLTELYGKEWLKNNKAVKHELVRPWWTVNKL